MHVDIYTYVVCVRVGHHLYSNLFNLFLWHTPRVQPKWTHKTNLAGNSGFYFIFHIYIIWYVKHICKSNFIWHKLNIDACISETSGYPMCILWKLARSYLFAYTRRQSDVAHIYDCRVCLYLNNVVTFYMRVYTLYIAASRDVEALCSIWTCGGALPTQKHPRL